MLMSTWTTSWVSWICRTSVWHKLAGDNNMYISLWPSSEWYCSACHWFGKRRPDSIFHEHETSRPMWARCALKKGDQICCKPAFQPSLPYDRKASCRKRPPSTMYISFLHCLVVPFYQIELLSLGDYSVGNKGPPVVRLKIGSNDIINQNKVVDWEKQGLRSADHEQWFMTHYSWLLSRKNIDWVPSAKPRVVGEDRASLRNFKY